MKEYPLTGGELYGLGAIGLAATLCFSGAAGLLGFAITLTKDIAFSSNVPEKIMVFWDTLRVGAFIGCGALALLGVVLVISGGIKVSAIKKETSHD